MFLTTSYREEGGAVENKAVGINLWQVFKARTKG